MRRGNVEPVVLDPGSVTHNVLFRIGLSLQSYIWAASHSCCLFLSFFLLFFLSSPSFCIDRMDPYSIRELPGLIQLNPLLQQIWMYHWNLLAAFFFLFAWGFLLILLGLSIFRGPFCFFLFMLSGHRQHWGFWVQFKGCCRDFVKFSD